MLLANLLHQMAHGTSEEAWDAWQEFNSASGSAAYEALIAALTSFKEEGYTFAILDLLARRFGPQINADAARVIPLLISKLVSEDGPIIDRATWALSNAGPASVEALIAAVQAAPSAKQKRSYLMALRKNPFVYVHANVVLALFYQHLLHPDAEVKYWAMVSLMDISPLRPWFNSNLDKLAFEPLYPRISQVAQEFIDSKQDEFATRYKGLIENHLA